MLSGSSTKFSKLVADRPLLMGTVLPPRPGIPATPCPLLTGSAPLPRPVAPVAPRPLLTGSAPSPRPAAPATPRPLPTVPYLEIPAGITPEISPGISSGIPAGIPAGNFVSDPSRDGGKKGEWEVEQI